MAATGLASFLASSSSPACGKADAGSSKALSNAIGSMRRRIAFTPRVLVMGHPSPTHGLLRPLRHLRLIPPPPRWPNERSMPSACGLPAPARGVLLSTVAGSVLAATNCQGPSSPSARNQRPERSTQIPLSALDLKMRPVVSSTESRCVSATGRARFREHSVPAARRPAGDESRAASGAARLAIPVGERRTSLN